MTDQRPVLVGVDGANSGRAAVRWAAREAALRSCPLRVVHAIGWRPDGDPGPAREGPAVEDDVFAELARVAHTVVDAAVAEAADAIGSSGPDVPISGAVLSRYAIPRLQTESESAQLLVLGTRARGAVGPVLSGPVHFGSVVRSVVPRSACPVVVVREEHGGLRHGSVVVGVDHRSTSDAALRFALEEARARGVGLVAVHAWRDAGFGSERLLADYAPTMVAAQRRCLTDELMAWREKYPDVDVQEVVRMHPPVGTLLDAAVGAALLVVGSRRRGPVRGMVLGSVGQAVLHRGPCPVAVVPPVER